MSGPLDRFGSPLSFEDSFLETKWDGRKYMSRYYSNLDAHGFMLARSELDIPTYIKWKAQKMILSERGSWLLINAKIDPTIKI